MLNARNIPDVYFPSSGPLLGNDDRAFMTEELRKIQRVLDSQRRAIMEIQEYLKTHV